MGLDQEAANPGFNYQTLKKSPELMRVPLILHEGHVFFSVHKGHLGSSPMPPTLLCTDIILYADTLT